MYTQVGCTGGHQRRGWEHTGGRRLFFCHGCHRGQSSNFLGSSIGCGIIDGLPLNTAPGLHWKVSVQRVDRPSRRVGDHGRRTARSTARTRFDQPSLGHDGPLLAGRSCSSAQDGESGCDSARMASFFLLLEKRTSQHASISCSHKPSNSAAQGSTYSDLPTPSSFQHANNTATPMPRASSTRPTAPTIQLPKKLRLEFLSITFPPRTSHPTTQAFYVRLKSGDVSYTTPTTDAIISSCERGWYACARFSFSPAAKLHAGRARYAFG